MTLIQVGVVQLGVVQLGLVQMGVDPAMTGVLRIYNTQTKINIKLRLFQLILFTVTVFSKNQSGAKFREWKKIFSAVPAFSELIQYL